MVQSIVLEIHSNAKESVLIEYSFRSWIFDLNIRNCYRFFINTRMTEWSKLFSFKANASWLNGNKTIKDSIYRNIPLDNSVFSTKVSYFSYYSISGVVLTSLRQTKSCAKRPLIKFVSPSKENDEQLSLI